MNPLQISFRAPKRLSISDIDDLAALTRAKLGFEKFEPLNTRLVRRIEEVGIYHFDQHEDGSEEFSTAYLSVDPNASPPEILLPDTLYYRGLSGDIEANEKVGHEVGHIECGHTLIRPGLQRPHCTFEQELSGEWQAELFSLLLVCPLQQWRVNRSTIKLMLSDHCVNRNADLFRQIDKWLRQQPLVKRM